MNTSEDDSWAEWYSVHVMPTVDQQEWEMRNRNRQYIEFEWTQARVANPAVGLQVPDVSNAPWLDNL
eukprot:3659184-Karenia_brevis.AAC.1